MIHNFFQLCELVLEDPDNIWQNAKLDGRNIEFGGKPGQNRVKWPKFMPMKGVLELEFIASLKHQRVLEALDNVNFRSVINELSDVAVSDFERLKLIRVVSKANYVTSQQARSIMNCFVWEAEKVEAAVYLFPRITDPQNFPMVLESMSHGEAAAVRQFATICPIVTRMEF